MIDPLRPRPSIWHIIRWLAVLPVAALTYLVIVVALIGASDSASVPISGIPEFTVLFAIATLVAVIAGAYTAPRHRLLVACALIPLLAGAFVYFTARAAPSGIRDTSLPPVTLGQMAAGLIAVLLVWRGGRGKV
ncbi:hypothetical protein [Deinococcus altitudinis]|uniref:hypothetical protein n=1 Tax=Deinococcus altitudinis TaxID=468914 RepID=UPI003892208A